MRFVSALSVIAFSLIVGGVAHAAAPLDGTEWRVEITPKGATVPHFIDRVSFKEGKFNSKIFESKGFTSSPYSAPSKKEPVVWEAKQTSETNGGLTWHGEIKGDSLQGTLAWKQADGKLVSHTLAGSRFIEEPATPAQSEPTPPATPEPAPKAKTPAPKTKKTP